jgi:hypothetical protein
MLQPGSYQRDEEWTDGVHVAWPVVQAGQSKGATVVIHNVELYWRPIGALWSLLSA